MVRQALDPGENDRTEKRSVNNRGIDLLEQAMNKYTKLFLKNRLLLIFVVGTLFFLLFFFVLLFNKNAIYPPAFALWIYVPGVVWFAIDVLLTIRFRKLIRYQEEFLNISFND